MLWDCIDLSAAYLDCRFSSSAYEELLSLLNGLILLTRRTMRKALGVQAAQWRSTWRPRR